MMKRNVFRTLLAFTLALVMALEAIPAEKLKAAETEVSSCETALERNSGLHEMVATGKKLKINPKKTTLTVGDTFSLTAKGAKAKKIKWSSKNPAVAGVDQNGLVTALSPGTAKIVAKFKKKKAKCKVKVVLPELTKTEIGTENLTADETTASITSPSGEIVVDLMPGLIEEGQEPVVKVSSVTGVPAPEGVEGLTAYDFDLSGASFSEGDVAEITVPFTLPSGCTPVAGYYNEKTGQNEPVYATYANGKLTITTTHFSTYWSGILLNGSCVWIEDPNTTKAYIEKVYGADVVELTAEESVRGIEENLDETRTQYSESTLKAAKRILKDIYGPAFEKYDNQISGTGDLLSIMQAVGLDDEEYYNGFLGDMGDIVGYLGFCNSMINAIGYYIDDNAAMAKVTTSIALGNLLLGFIFKALGTSASVSGAYSFSIGKVLGDLASGYEQVLDANEKKYFDAYNAAYETYEASRYGGLKKHLYEWRDMLAPCFNDKNLTAKEAAAAVDKVVDDYVNFFWDDPARLDILWMNTYQDQPLIAGTGLDPALQDKITKAEKKKLYDYEVKVVTDWFLKKAREDDKRMAVEKAQALADELNVTINLDFYDSNAGKEGSDLAGYTVRFKSIPGNLLDPENLQVELDKKGEGRISYNLWAALNYGIQPVVEVVDLEGKVMNEVDFKFVAGTKKIDVAKEYLELTPEKLSLAPGEKGKLTVKGIDIKKVSFKSSNEEIVKLGETGENYIEVVAGDVFGTSTITAEAPGGLMASSVVTVEETLIDIDPPEVTLTSVGESKNVYLVEKSTGPDGSTQTNQIDFDSWSQNSGKKVCEVKKEGKGLKITAKETGTSEIEVVYNGVKYYCNVTVTIEEIPGEYYLSDDRLTLEVGETAVLYLLYYENGEETQELIPSYVNDYGEIIDTQRGNYPDYGLYITGLSEGSATLTITDEGGGTHTCEVKVVKKSEGNTKDCGTYTVRYKGSTMGELHIRFPEDMPDYCPEIIDYGSGVEAWVETDAVGAGFSNGSIATMDSWCGHKIYVKYDSVGQKMTLNIKYNGTTYQLHILVSPTSNDDDDKKTYTTFDPRTGNWKMRSGTVSIGTVDRRYQESTDDNGKTVRKWSNGWHEVNFIRFDDYGWVEGDRDGNYGEVESYTVSALIDGVTYEYTVNPVLGDWTESCYAQYDVEHGGSILQAWVVDDYHKPDWYRAHKSEWDIHSPDYRP